jgi:hypothetical protein
VGYCWILMASAPRTKQSGQTRKEKD